MQVARQFTVLALFAFITTFADTSTAGLEFSHTEDLCLPKPDIYSLHRTKIYWVSRSEKRWECEWRFRDPTGRVVLVSTRYKAYYYSITPDPPKDLSDYIVDFNNFVTNNLNIIYGKIRPKRKQPQVTPRAPASGLRGSVGDLAGWAVSTASPGWVTGDLYLPTNTECLNIFFIKEQQGDPDDSLIVFFGNEVVFQAALSDMTPDEEYGWNYCPPPEMLGQDISVTYHVTGYSGPSTVFVSEPVFTASTSELPDSDSDGIDDSVDNCPTVPNADQFNFDGTDAGDACDPDDDNDSWLDVEDNCPKISNPGQEPSELEMGRGVACEGLPPGC